MYEVSSGPMSMSAESTSGSGSDFRSLPSAGRCRTLQTLQMGKVSHSGRTWGTWWTHAEITREAGKIQGVNLRRSSELHVSRRMGDFSSCLLGALPRTGGNRADWALSSKLSVNHQSSFYLVFVQVYGGAVGRRFEREKAFCCFGIK